MKKIQDIQIEVTRGGSKVISIDDPVGLCSDCDGKGLVTVDVEVGHWAFGKAFPCPNPDCKTGQALAQRKYKKIFGDGCLQRYTFESWDALPLWLTDGKWRARWAAEEFVRADGGLWWIGDTGESHLASEPGRKGIIFAGVNGVGKTGLFTAMANALINLKRRVLVTNAMGMFDVVQSTYGRDSKLTKDEVYNVLVNTPYLFVDEMNVSKQTEDRIEIAERVFRRRAERGLPFVITTNHLNLDSFVGEWGNRTATAVFESCYWIQLDKPVIRSHTKVIHGG